MRDSDRQTRQREADRKKGDRMVTWSYTEKHEKARGRDVCVCVCEREREKERERGGVWIITEDNNYPYSENTGKRSLVSKYF